MLQSLHIENIAVIKRVDIELGDGLTVLTGETGAGKSILIDSVNLLLGGKFNRELIRVGQTTAHVSGLFTDLGDDVLTELAENDIPVDAEERMLRISRSVSADGKSNFRMEGRPVSAATVRRIGAMLLNIHGQNDNQALLQKSAHLQLLDAMGDLQVLHSEYADAYRALIKCRGELEKLTGSDAEKVRRAEMLSYQIKDIAAAKLKTGEEEALLAKRIKLQNAEKIQKQVNLITTALDARDKNGSAVYLINRSCAALRQLSAVIPQAEELAARLESMMYDVRDVADEVSTWCDDDMSEDPSAALDAIEGRLEQISRLKRKYGESVEMVLAFAQKAQSELDALESAKDRIDALQLELKELQSACMQAADRLTERRRALADEITARIHEELAFLDMPKVRFAVSIRPCADFTATGRDDVEFLISTNPGQELMPLIKIASGGELARLMLAIKTVLNDRDGVGCVVFDEVDTGISGKTSRKVGIRLRQMAKSVQVVCITHSAQIASLADTHALISKTEQNGLMETDVTLLDEDGRVGEIARIMGGIEITEVQRQAAREMIEERLTL
jgi:DNA repair protein RecN (Recombination protein N)